MQTRLRTGSLPRKASVDTNDGRMGSGLDFSGISDDAGAAQLVAGLKDTTSTRSAARAIPGTMHESSTAAESSGSAAIAHTPPTVSTSYENQHFGKRPRAGVSNTL